MTRATNRAARAAAAARLNARLAPEAPPMRAAAAARAEEFVWLASLALASESK
jgi:hypothetical protein